MRRLIFLLPLILAGCAGGFNYKGVQVTIDQRSDIKADDGSIVNSSQTSDADETPDHQQGSDTAVPLIKELGKAYKRKLDVMETLIEECLDSGKSLAECKIGVPDIGLPTDPEIPQPPVIPEPPVDPGDVPVPNSSWTGGNLWKPVSESRGGVPVVLTKASAPACNDLKLYNDTDQIPASIEYRGRTNGDRWTMFVLDKKAGELPANLVVDACTQVFLVPDPTQRYD